MEESRGSRLPARLVLTPGLSKLSEVILVARVLLHGDGAVSSFLLQVLVLLEELILILFETLDLLGRGLELLLLQVVLLGHGLVLTLDGIQLLDFCLGLGEPALERLDGDFEDFGLSLVLQVGVDLLFQLEVELLNLVFECLRVLNVGSNLLGNLHPRGEGPLEAIDVEDIVDSGDGGLAVFLLVALLDVLDQPLEFVVVEDLGDVSLDGIQERAPVFALDLDWIGDVAPDHLDDIKFFCEPFINNEVLHVEVFFAGIISVDVVKLEDYVDEPSVNQGGFVHEVLVLGPTTSENFADENLQSHGRKAHPQCLMPDVELEGLLNDLLSFELCRGHLVLGLVVVLLGGSLLCQLLRGLFNEQLLDLDVELRNLSDESLQDRGVKFETDVLILEFIDNVPHLVAYGVEFLPGHERGRGFNILLDTHVINTNDDSLRRVNEHDCLLGDINHHSDELNLHLKFVGVAAAAVQIGRAHV